MARKVCRRIRAFKCYCGVLISHQTLLFSWSIRRIVKYYAIFQKCTNTINNKKIIKTKKFHRQKCTKQKTNRKNILTAGKQYFIKRFLEILTNSMRNTFEGSLKMYFLTDVFMQFLKTSKTLFGILPDSSFSEDLYATS